MEKKFKGKQNTFYFNESALSDKIDRKTLPLSVTLGWAGSIEPHVYKYTKIYENFGHHTIRFAPTAKKVLFEVHQHKDLAIELLNLIIEKNLTDCPIVIHAFSNAGVMIYRYLSEIAHSNEREYEKYKFLKVNLKSLIFDSGPGHALDMKALVGSIAELLENQIKFKIIRYIFVICFLLFVILKHIYPFNRDNTYFAKYTKAIVNDQFKVPLLVYYSPVDRFVDYRTLFAIIKDRLKQVPDAQIITVEFSDSKHVAHYLKYPNVYIEKLKEHLSLCKVSTY